MIIAATIERIQNYIADRSSKADFENGILGVTGLKKDIAKYVDRGTAPKGFEAALPDGSLAINPVRVGDNGGSYYLLSPKFVEGKPYCRVLESSLDNLNLAELVKEVI